MTDSPTKHARPSSYSLQALQIVFLDTILLDKFSFSESLEVKPLAHGRYTESTILLQGNRGIAFHWVCCVTFQQLLVTTGCVAWDSVIVKGMPMKHWVSNQSDLGASVLLTGTA